MGRRNQQVASRHVAQMEAVSIIFGNKNKFLEMVKPMNNFTREKVNINSRTFYVASTSSNVNCNYCNEADGHQVFNCKEFLKLDIEERVQQIKTQGLCLVV